MVRILPARAIAVAETDGLLPELTIQDGKVLFRVLYTDTGVPDGAIRFTDPDIVEPWTEYVRKAQDALIGTSADANGSPGDSANDLSGSSRDVVRAGNVTGDIHFHQAPEASYRPRTVPRQLPADVYTFVNRTAEQAHLHTILTSRDGGQALVSVHVVAGTAGAGKTSLVLRWAHQVKEARSGWPQATYRRTWSTRPPSTVPFSPTAGCSSCSTMPPRSAKCARCSPAAETASSW
ncbi:hypothetical protein ACH4S9_09125 [Streptomyces sp. NPDC021225]|uniref:hypothetical protein n=1 Tax=Streptomyces sp. NPDC021225 TaxID=3365121 RepID=UPI00379A4444